ncbi:MAG: hypothetical protein K6E10_04930 [Eubacterium sp.]|nr:hypothetical protein [Eubacterium sp.]
MIIKCCMSCGGKPYTEDLDMCICPNCGDTLVVETIADKNVLRDRKKIEYTPVIQYKEEKTDDGDYKASVSSEVDFVFPGFEDYDAPINERDKFCFENTIISNDISQKSADIINSEMNNYPQRISTQGTLGVGNYGLYNNFSSYIDEEGYITGRVSRYSSTLGGEGNNRNNRNIFEKIIDALVYKQKFDDELHRFYLYIENNETNGYSDSVEIPVNIYGTIDRGMNINDNEMVSVSGKFNRNNIFMANEVRAVGMGHDSRIQFRPSIAGILYAILFIVGLILFLYSAFTCAGSFVDNMKSFMITWGIVCLVTFVLLFGLFGLFLRNFWLLFAIFFRGSSASGRLGGSLATIYVVITFLLTFMIQINFCR